MIHTNYKETLVFLGSLTIKPILIFFLNLFPISFKKFFLVPFIVNITRINWKFGYVIALYLNEYTKKLFSNEIFIISKTRFGHYLKVPVSDNHFLYRLTGLYHPDKFIKQLKKEIENCTHICEIGTHLGELSVWFKQNTSNAKFTAFELHPEFVKYVDDSLAINKFSDYKVINAVVGLNPISTRGYGDFYSLIEAFPELHVGASLEDKFFTDKFVDNIELPLNNNQTIKSVDLTEFFTKNPPDFYFMDIEGCEIYAIPMIIELNNKFNLKAKIVFEIHHYAYSGVQARKLKQLLIDNKYEIYSIDNRHLFCV